MLLNSDMGESFGEYRIGADAEVMPHVDMANIACGMHASDPDVMNLTVALAAQHGVHVGAHPGYPDLQGFGRRDLGLSPGEVKNLALYQVGAMAAFCSLHQAHFTYIKPHGALYNTMMRERAILEALIQVAAQSKLKLMILATAQWQEHQEEAAKYGVELILEGFVDRGYEDDGTLVHRQSPGALLDRRAMIKRVQELCAGKPLTSIHGRELHVPIDSLCVHGDGDGVPLIQQFREIIDRSQKTNKP